MEEPNHELRELKRWKSTHAPRLAALEALLHAAQHEAHAGKEAIATLASERAANALLTDEVDRLRARVLELEAVHEDASGAILQERERCAMKLQVTRADVSLAAGELSAQEWRTCASVLRWMQGRIRAG